MIDRVTASVIGERHVTLEFLPIDAPEAREQIVSGIYPDHWMTGTAIVALKSRAEARKLKFAFYLPNASPRTSADDETRWPGDRRGNPR